MIEHASKHITHTVFKPLEDTVGLSHAKELKPNKIGKYFISEF